MLDTHNDIFCCNRDRFHVFRPGDRKGLSRHHSLPPGATLSVERNCSAGRVEDSLREFQELR